MRATFRPIDQWVGERTPRWKQRPKRTFRGGYDDTLQLLDRELTALKATEVVIQLEMSDRDIRLDGLPRANATPSGPAVIVAFESKHGPLKYATDVFDHWHANLRAIALGLEALRKVERYGISSRGEQYRGWQQLGSGIEMGAATMTADAAARFVADHAGGVNSGTVRADINEKEAAYRRAAKALHPDAGGSTADFQKLQEAKRILDGAAS